MAIVVRNAILHCVKHGYRSLALPVPASVRAGFPRVLAAHVMFRTVRRLLQMAPVAEAIDRVILVPCSALDVAVYRRVGHLYFPRCDAEALSLSPLVVDGGGDKWGMGTDVLHRGSTAYCLGASATSTVAAIGRIGEEVNAHTPHLAYMRRVVKSIGTFYPLPDDALLARSVKSRADVKREQLNRRYSQLLKRARSADLAGIASRDVVYQSGVDLAGRPVLYVIGSRIPSPKDSQMREAVLCYTL
eukprot:g13531.t1